MTPRGTGASALVFDRFYVPRVCAGISESRSPTDGAWSEAIRRSIDVTSDLLVADLWAPLRNCASEAIHLINEIVPWTSVALLRAIQGPSRFGPVIFSLPGMLAR